MGNYNSLHRLASFLQVQHITSLRWRNRCSAKTIELDARIPYISKLRRSCNSNFSLKEFKKAELTLLENVDWNPQFTSTLEFLNFFLAQGVVYSSDEYFREDYEKEALKENTQNVNRPNVQNKEKLGNGIGLVTATKKVIPYENSKEGYSGGRAGSFSKKTPLFLPAISTKLGLLPETRIFEIAGKIESAAGKLCKAVVKRKITFFRFSLEIHTIFNRHRFRRD